MSEEICCITNNGKATPSKDGLSKKIALEHAITYIIGKDDNSFSRIYDLTPQTENKSDFS